MPRFTNAVEMAGQPAIRCADGEWRVAEAFTKLIIDNNGQVADIYVEVDKLLDGTIAEPVHPDRADLREARYQVAKASRMNNPPHQ